MDEGAPLAGHGRLLAKISGSLESSNTYHTTGSYTDGRNKLSFQHLL